MRKFRNRRRLIGALACGFLAFGPWIPAGAGPRILAEPLPGSCKTHPNKVVTPGCVPALAETVGGAIEEALTYEHTYPDLVPNVTETYVNAEFTFDEPSGTFVLGPPKLFFDTVAQNLGEVAVDIESDDPANQQNPTASQCVAWTELFCRERRPAGAFEIHPDHGHIHFLDFAKYELRKLHEGGTVDFSESGLVAISDKVSFCLIDLMKVRDDALPAGTYNTCSDVREGISPGWADVYGAALEGQQFPLEGVQEGTYAIVIAMNYTGGLLETDYSNNRVAVTVELQGLSDIGTATATITGRAWI